MKVKKFATHLLFSLCLFNSSPGFADVKLKSESTFQWIVHQLFPPSKDLNLSPILPDGSALFSYTNESGLSDDNIFVQVLGVNPNTQNQCFIIYDNEGKASYFDVTEKIDSTQYAYSLSQFPKGEGAARLLYLPKLQGARIYTSITEKIFFLVSQNDEGVWTISAPNLLDPNDPNIHTLWDKTEFTVDSNAIFINPTAVDNFSLPLRCEEIGTDGSKQGGGLTEKRSEVFNDMTTALNLVGSPWTELLSQNPSVIYSPMFASAVGVFPQDYFVQNGWINAFVELFSQQPLMIDASESFPINLGGGIWNGIVDPTTRIITFSRIVDDIHPEVPSIYLTLPTNTSELLAGAGPSWNITAGSAILATFARDISCAIDTNTLTTQHPLCVDYFKNNSENFYRVNPQLPEELQFIDIYSKVLHRYGDHHIYTLPYDDELSQSGAASYAPQNFASGSIHLGAL